MTTPRLTDHARDRAKEMGIRTRRVKNAVRNPDLSYASYDDRMVAVDNDDPPIAVVFHPGDPPTVVTVLWRTHERWEREPQEVLR
jgi:hypothetical protein